MKDRIARTRVARRSCGAVRAVGAWSTAWARTTWVGADEHATVEDLKTVFAVHAFAAFDYLHGR